MLANAAAEWTTARCLVSGLNATGHSLLYSVEGVGECAVVQARCLVNAGDSTQRFCMDNRLKMMKLRCVIITSLAPHNVSGLAGILLCLADLGAGALTIIGPTGIQGLFDVMTPFTNKRYPELTVFEVSSPLQGWMRIPIDDFCHVEAHAVWAAPSLQDAQQHPQPQGIAIAARVSLRRHRLAPFEESLAVLPVSSRFSIRPSFSELWVHLSGSGTGSSAGVCVGAGTGIGSGNGRGNGGRIPPQPPPPPPPLPLPRPSLAVFSPISSLCQTSLCLPFLRSFCSEHLLTGCWFEANGAPSGERHCEFTKAQERAALLHWACPGLFPAAPLPCVGRAVERALENGEIENGVVVSFDGSGGAVAEERKGSLMRAAPMLYLGSGSGSGAGPSPDRGSESGDSQSEDESSNDSDTDQSSHRGSDCTDERHPSFRLSKLAAVAAASIQSARRAGFSPATHEQVQEQEQEQEPATKRARQSPQLQTQQRHRSRPNPEQIDIDGSDGEEGAVGTKIGGGLTALPEYLDFQSGSGDSDRGSDFVKACFLGTGCASPSRLRANSCTWLRVTQQGQGHVQTQPQAVGVLLDCGEGAASQLFSAVSGCPVAFRQSLLGLRLLWVSHHHADHITGVPMLVQWLGWALAQEEGQGSGLQQGNEQGQPHKQAHVRLLIIAPPAALAYFSFALSACGLDHLVRLEPTSLSLYAGCSGLVQEATRGVLSRVVSVPVQHCRQAYGVVLELALAGGRPSAGGGGFRRIVYSGDCRPSTALASAGQGASLLIHEATFSDCLAVDAVRKGHCTHSEAVGVGREMRASCVVLTHFSQRYASNQATSSSSTSGLPTHSIRSAEAGAGAGAGGGFVLALDLMTLSLPSQARAAPVASEAVGRLLGGAEVEGVEGEAGGGEEKEIDAENNT